VSGNKEVYESTKSGQKFRADLTPWNEPYRPFEGDVPDITAEEVQAEAEQVLKDIKIDEG
jgi:hypothetical protein